MQLRLIPRVPFLLKGEKMKQQQIQALEARLRREYKSLTGLVVRKNGLLQYAYSQNGASLEGAVHLYSVTKSILSALVGIAISKGLLEGACQKVLDFFPDYRAQPEKRGSKPSPCGICLP